MGGEGEVEEGAAGMSNEEDGGGLRGGVGTKAGDDGADVS